MVKNRSKIWDNVGQCVLDQIISDIFPIVRASLVHDRLDRLWDQETINTIQLMINEKL